MLGDKFSSTGQLVTLDLVDSSIGAMAEGLALIDMEALVVKDVLLSLKHWMCHCAGLAFRTLILLQYVFKSINNILDISEY